MTTYEQSPLTQLDLLTSLPEGSPAKTSALPDAKRAYRIKHVLDYGASSPELLARYDQDSQSWKTSQISLADRPPHLELGLAGFSETWPRSGLMRNGTAYRLPLSALHTYETGCGYWPTPNKSNGFVPFSMETMRRKKAGLGRKRNGTKMGFDLKWEERAVPYLVNGWINPILSEWLMGFPIGHTDLEPLGTPSSLKFPK